MASPNIADVVSIYGRTTVKTSVSTSSTSVLDGVSEKLFKVNTLMASNKTSGSVSATVVFNQGGVTGYLAYQIQVPPGSSIAIIGKDTPVYVDENGEITASAGTATALDIVCSYEEIDDA